MGPAFVCRSDSVHPSERSQPRFRSQYHLRSLRQYLRSLRDFDDTRLVWDPGPRHQCHRVRYRRARPSKRGRTSGPGESSSTRHQPSPVTSAAEATSSPQLSFASRIRRPLFVRNPIPGNVRLHRREFHKESYYDVLALTADPRFRDSMRLIEDYSLLPFMTPRHYYYPRVVL